MRKPLLKIFSALVLIIMLSGCAQVVPLTGGERDSTPPKLVNSFPALNTTFFAAKKITLTFNEFVQLRDLPNQLVISPRLKTDPLINAEGKNIVIELDPAELASNTTYRFAFGKAIADMNESNPAENFEYVFSTGKSIDSLKLSGNVTDALTTRGLSAITVGLYKKQSADSLPYIYVPEYSSKTNENGEFHFRNLPEGEFQVFAIADKNKNGLYEGESEKIGFLNGPFQLGSDSSIRIKIFQEEPSKSFIKRSISSIYGLSQIILNKRSSVTLRTLDPNKMVDIREIQKGKEKDTVAFFYRNFTDSLQILFSNHTSGKTDTLKLLLPKNSRSKKPFTSFNLNTPGNNLGLTDKLQLQFLNWMDSSKTRLKRMKISSQDDSLITLSPLEGKWTALNIFEFSNKFREGLNYTLKIDSGAFVDIYGNTNDTMLFNFKRRNSTEFGKVTLKITLNKKQSYVIQLINDQMIVAKEKTLAFTLSSSNSASIDFTEVPPGVYQVKIIFDDNENQKWDSGNLLLRKQPEQIMINSKLLKVLSDWEIEEEITEKDQK